MPVMKVHSPSPGARTQTCTRMWAHTHVHALPWVTDRYGHPVCTWILSSPHTQGLTFTKESCQ